MMSWTAAVCFSVFGVVFSNVEIHRGETCEVRNVYSQTQTTIGFIPCVVAVIIIVAVLYVRIGQIAYSASRNINRVGTLGGRSTNQSGAHNKINQSKSQMRITSVWALWLVCLLWRISRPWLFSRWRWDFRRPTVWDGSLPWLLSLGTSTRSATPSSTPGRTRTSRRPSTSSSSGSYHRKWSKQDPETHALNYTTGNNNRNCEGPSVLVRGITGYSSWLLTSYPWSQRTKMPIAVLQKHLLHKVNNTQYRWENLDEWQLIWNLFPLNSYCHSLMPLILWLTPLTADSLRSQLLFYHHSSAVFDYLKGTSQNNRRIQETETRSHVLNSPELEVTARTY